MENLILSPLAIDELCDLIADKVEARINRPAYSEPLTDNISLHEACSLLGLSKSMVYKLTMKSEIPFQKFGKRLVFSRKALIEWMEKRTTTPPNASDLMAERLSITAKKQLKKG